MADETETVRQTLAKVSAEQKDAYVAALKNSKRFTFKSYLPVTENCHFERYNFLHNQGKLGIVYDTKAEILSLTARRIVLGFAVADAGIDTADSVVQTQNGGEESDAQPKESPAPSPAPEQSKNASGVKAPVQSKNATSGVKAPVQKENSTDRPAKSKPQKAGDNKPTEKQAVAKAQPARPTENQQERKASPKKEKAAKPIPAPPKPVNPPVAAADAPEYKNGFAVKKCPMPRLEGIVKRIQGLKGVTVHTDKSQADVITYTIADKSRQQKCLLRYTPKKQSVQLQGKRSNLFGEVQVILSSDSGFSEAVGSHMELTDAPMRMSAVQRSLKKLLPDAFSLLSEQSKIDLGIGMIDIGNAEVRLSDYSVLLVPPYRGLERFIFDLQQARGISVKMIGQAYEKDESGRHVLKLCYRKKTGIVYSEVMSALYTEYFEKRNFYAHSDNTDSGSSRVIADKSAAESIFDHLCEIINYNSKKLKETGFSVTPQKN